MELRNKLQQTQTQHIFPSMLQSLNVLQLPVAELEQLVSQEIQKNPFLELTSLNTPSGNFHNTEGFSSIFEDTFSQNSRHNDNFTDDQIQNYLLNIPRNSSAPEYLLEQVPDIDDGVKRALTILIEHLDERGFLSKDTLRELDSENWPASQREAYGLLRTLHPRGIGALDLQDCLLLQLEENSQLYRLIAEHFEDLERHRFVKLQRIFHCDVPELRKLLNPLKLLNFSPKKAISNPEVSIIKPEIFFTKDQGIWNAQIKNVPWPQMNDNYKNLLTKKLNREDRKFFTIHKNSAQLLIKSLQQRYQTLQKIAQYILHFQKNFLENGVEALHPQSMKQVAEIILVNASTLSRAANEKYVKVNREIFPLKIFFSHGNSNSLFSQPTLAEKIKNIIKNESQNAPLSDEKIANILKNEGLWVSRRMVTKYRNFFKILPSNARKILAK